MRKTVRDRQLPPRAKDVPNSHPSTSVRSKTPVAHPINGGPLAWRFSAADRGGPFSWAVLEQSEAFGDIVRKLANFETMQQKDLQQQGAHPIDIDSLSAAAIERLEDLQLDDLDRLMSFRFSNRMRVFCRAEANIMHVLWWDPHHLVCPSTKKHT